MTPLRVQAQARRPGIVISLPSLTYGIVVSLDSVYHEIFEGYYAALMAQTHLKDFYDKISYSWDTEKQERTSDLSAVVASLQESLANNPEQGKELLSRIRSLDSWYWTLAAKRLSLIPGDILPAGSQSWPGHLTQADCQSTATGVCR